MQSGKNAKTQLNEKQTKVVEVLNKARSMELQGILQYMNQHYKLDDLDYGQLASKMKKIAIDEMRHAESLGERIKEIGGEPTSELAGPVEKNQDINDIYPFDANLEGNTINVYNDFLHVCLDNNDVVSAELFKKLTIEEQDHFNYFDDVANHLKNLGASYLAHIAGTKSED